MKVFGEVVVGELCVDVEVMIAGELGKTAPRVGQIAFKLFRLRVGVR